MGVHKSQVSARASVNSGHTRCFGHPIVTSFGAFRVNSARFGSEFEGIWRVLRLVPVPARHFRAQVETRPIRAASSGSASAAVAPPRRARSHSCAQQRPRALLRHTPHCGVLRHALNRTARHPPTAGCYDTQPTHRFATPLTAGHLLAALTSPDGTPHCGVTRCATNASLRTTPRCGAPPRPRERDSPRLQLHQLDLISLLDQITHCMFEIMMRKRRTPSSGANHQRDWPAVSLNEHGRVATATIKTPDERTCPVFVSCLRLRARAPRER
jgi:hypothetical protein